MPDLTITDNTNPKIVELYQQLQDAKSKIDKIQSEHLDKLNENYQAMKEKEQSKENRTLTAATTAATGIGGMELAQGLAEQRADKTAEQDMAAYLATMRCEYGNGKQVKAGPDEIELPGGNDAEMMKLRAEYFALAADLKERKAALGMKPGIESEEILDKSQLDLYNDESIGITDGVYASIYRAQMLGSAADQEQIDADKNTSKNRVIGGGVAAGAGVVGGIVGNAIINKDAPKESSDKINREYDKQVAEATAEQDNISQQLNQAIAENAAAVQEYNNQIEQHKNQIALINKSPASCRDLFTDYVDTVNEMQPIANETDNVPQNTDFPDINEQQELLDKCQTCDTKGGVFDSETNSCSCPPAKPVEKDGKCVEKPVEISAPITNEPVVEPEPVIDQEPVAGITPENEKTAEEQMPETENNPEDETTGTEDSEGEYCPATGNGLKSITDKTKIGDECSSTNIAQGEVVWRKDKKSCTCLAYVCNDGFHSKGGQCLKNEEKLPLCPRQKWNNVENIKTGNDALKFCERKATEICTESYHGKSKIAETGFKENCKKQYPKGCVMTRAIMYKNNGKKNVLCNGTQDEQSEAKQKIATQKQEAMYKAVCGDDKNKTGKKEYCVSDFFNWTQTTLSYAINFARDYARLKHGNTIQCSDEEPRKAGNDDYIKCATKDGSILYEFKFDDVHESVKEDRYLSERSALCRLIGGDVRSIDNNRICYKINSDACTKKLNPLAQKYGHTAKWEKDRCNFYTGTVKQDPKNSIYKEVCGADKGKTGKKEYCVSDFFNWTQTQMLQATGFAQDYARLKHGNTIQCSDEEPRKAGNDDYIKCATKDGSILYEFKFDDVKEGVDVDRRLTERSALCRLIGGDVRSVDNNRICYKISSDTCTKKLNPLAQKYGHTVKWEKDRCNFTVDGDRNNMDTQEFENSLAKIDGLDNYYLFTEIQIRGSKNLIRQLESYVKSQNIKYSSFRCNDGYETVKKVDNSDLKTKVVSVVAGNHDDILRCYVDKKPIDFVFDDLSETWKTTRESGESAIECKISGGVYANKNCHGLNFQECTEMGNKLKEQNPQSSGTDYINGDCVLLDVQEQNRLDKGIQIATGVVTLVDCAIGTHLGCKLAIVEGVSLVMEMTSGAEMQKRADEFLKVAAACKNRSCAKNTLKTLGGRAYTVADQLSSLSTAKSIDEKLAELIGYLEPEDLQGEISDDDFAEIIRQLGGDPNDLAGRALKTANKIGFIGQFASVGASTLRLTGKAVAKLGAKAGSKTAVRAGSNMADALDTTKKTADASKGASKSADAANDATKGAGKTADAADDASKGTSGATGKGSSTNSSSATNSGARTTGSGSSGGNTSKGTNGANDASKNSSQTTGKSSGTSGGSANNAGAKTTGRVYDAGYFDTNPSATETVFKNADDMVQINRQNMKASTLRDLMRNAEKHGFGCAECGGDVLKFVKKADSAGDATKGAGKTADAAGDASKGTSGATGKGSSTNSSSATNSGARTTGSGSSGGNTSKGTNGANDASKNSSQTTGKSSGTSGGSANNATKNTSKSGNAASVSADEAKAANVATLKKQASKNFDTYLAEAKNSKNGRSTHVLAKENLTDEGWNAINESLAHENVQLIEVTKDGKKYMQFVSADHVDDVFDVHNMRVSDGTGNLYVRNSAQEMLGFRVNGSDAVSEIDQLYSTIRRGIEYPVNDTKVSKAISAMERPSSSGVVYREPTSTYRWHMNGYQGSFSKRAEYHVSLNVDVDDNLIKKLNEIISKDKGQHIVYYKIPTAGSSNWKTMADPITIYLSKTSPEIERAIASVAKPYVRTSSEIGLLGRKIDDGVAIAYETSDLRTDIVQDIINQVARKDPGVANALRGQGRRYSVGKTEALRLWASDFLGYTIAPVIP